MKLTVQSETTHNDVVLTLPTDCAYAVRLLGRWVGKKKHKNYCLFTMPELTPVLVLTKKGEEKAAIRLNHVEVLVIDLKKSTGNIHRMGTLKCFYPSIGKTFFPVSEYLQLSEFAKNHSGTGAPAIFYVYCFGSVVTLSEAATRSMGSRVAV